MLQRLQAGVWQDVNKLEKMWEGVFADCEFARREQAGAWVDVWSGYAGNFYIMSQPAGCELTTYNNGELLITWTPSKSDLNVGEERTCILGSDIQEIPKGTGFTASFNWTVNADQCLPEHMNGYQGYIHNWIIPQIHCNFGTADFTLTPWPLNGAVPGGNGIASYYKANDYWAVNFARLEICLEKRMTVISGASLRFKISNFKINGKRYRF